MVNSVDQIRLIILFRKKHLKEFLLELGKGFMFVGTQVRITLDEDYFYPNLVFYTRLVKCFVIIDITLYK